MTRGFSYLVLLLLATAGVSLSAQTQSVKLELRPGAELHLQIAPGTEQPFPIQIPAGRVAFVSVEQMTGTAQVRWVMDGAAGPGTGDERVNRSGRRSTIEFHLAGSADTSGSLIVRSLSKAPIEVRVTEAALRVATDADREAMEAERAMARAVADSADHRPESARQSLPLLHEAEEKWRSLGDRVNLARALAFEAYNEAFPMSDGAAALARLPELVEVAAQIEALSSVEAGNARKTAGFVYAKQADYADSLTQYTAALPLFERTADLFNRVVVLENRAKVERIQGHSGLALADVQAAIPLAQANSDARGELALEVERGAIAFASGQLGVAYEANLRAVALAQGSQDKFLAGQAWSDLGVVYTELGDFAEANRAFDRADEIWKQTPNAYGEIQTVEDRAELRLEEGDLPAAGAAFEAGAEQAAKSSLAREHSYFLRGRAVSEMRRGKTGDAREHLRKAIDEAEQVKATDILSAMYASAGDLAAMERNWKLAAEEWQQAAAAAEKGGAALDRAVALGGLVRAALELGNVDEASGRCHEAMDALESIREGISDSDLRLSFFSSRHALYDLCVQTELKRDDAQEAFNVAERGRARLLLEQATASGVEAVVPGDLLARIDENDRRLALLRRRLTRVKGSEPKTGDAEGLLQARQQLRKEAEASGIWGVVAASAVPFTAREVMERLDDRTALVAYWLGRERSCIWLVTNKRMSLYRLPAGPQIEARTKVYMAALLAPVAVTVSRSAAERVKAVSAAAASAALEGGHLRRMLLPMAIPAGIRTVLVVADGALLTLSFASLPETASGYLGQRYELATEPSATLAFRTRTATVGFSRLQFVVFSDPANFGSSGEAGVASPGVRVERIALTTPLPYARDEARVIGEIFGERRTRVFTGAAASRRNALGLDWRSYGVAHFATHAVFRETHPELSGLILAGPEGADGGAADGAASLLSFSDVLRMKAHLELAVLNACNSDRGRYVPGEGKLALDNAFLAAGTARVIGALWPVDDEASSVFMAYFYRALAVNHSPLRSLREAQQKMADSARWKAPYYWGAFALSGDWHPFAQ